MIGRLFRAIRRNCSNCPHSQEAHEHYRAGTNCSLCSCPKFR